MKTHPVCNAFRAEFHKITAFRFPLFGCIGIAVYVALVTFEMVHSERMLDHVHTGDAFTLVPFLAWSTWVKLFILPVFLIAFGTYCTLVDSQYGMIRVGCSQPLTRLQYISAKTAAVLSHSTVFISVYSLMLLASSALCGMRFTITGAHALQFAVFYVRLLLFCTGFTWLVVAAALFRKTLLEGFAAAIFLMVGMIWMNILPVEYGLRPFLLFRYFLHPVAPILPSDWNFEIPNSSCSFLQFCVAVLAVPASIWAFAAALFARRDIVE